MPQLDDRACLRPGVRCRTIGGGGRPVPHENAKMDRGGLSDERRSGLWPSRARKRLYLSHSQTRARCTRPDALQRQEPLFDEPLRAKRSRGITPRQSGLSSSAPLQATGGALGARAEWVNTARAGRQAERSSCESGPCSQQSAESLRTGIKAGIAAFHNKFGEARYWRWKASGDDAAAGQLGRHGTMAGWRWRPLLDDCVD